MRVELHADAPPKPEWGEGCNGCGLCCAVETCPLGLVLFRRRQGPCPALAWAEGRYHCGVLTDPGRHIPFLPRSWAARLVARWIAAGKGCDCHYRLDDHPV